MLPGVQATGGAGEAVGHDPAAGSAGRRPSGAARLAETPLVLPDIRVSAEVVYRAGRAGPGPIEADHPAASGGRCRGRRRRPHDRAVRPRPRRLLAGRRRGVHRPRRRSAAGRARAVEVLGIDEVRRGKPHWSWDEQAGSWTTTTDRWHVGFCDLSGGQGLLAQVEGRTTAAVTGWLTERRSDPEPASRVPVGLECVRPLKQRLPDG
jgi:hypothetical protein